MKNVLQLIAIVTVSAAPLAYSDTIYNGAAGGLVTDVLNWNNGAPTNGNPGTVTSIDVTSNEDWVDQVITFTDSTVTRAAGNGSITLDNVALTFNGNGDWELAGQDSNADNLVIGKAANSTVSWNSTGSILSVNNFTLGGNGISGFLNQSAGTIAFANMTLKTTSKLTVSGGTLSFSGTIDFRDASETQGGVNYIDFLTTGTTGAVTMATAALADVQAFIDAGQIRLDGTAQTVGDYSNFSLSSDGGSGTVITIIPEPATLGLVAAFGGGILFIRRKLMM